MPRTNGSYIGFDANPNANVASGIWTVRDAERLLRADKWPAAPTVPGAPTGTPGDQQVALTWAAPSGGQTPTDYIIQYSSNGGADWQTFSDGVSSATTATVTGLTNGTGYIFRVQATNLFGAGPVGSASGTITPVAPAPWAAFLASPDGQNTIAAYDWRESDGSTLSGLAGPTLTASGISIDSEGGLFDSLAGSYAESAQTVTITYPFTIAIVSNAVVNGESVFMSFGQSPPMATLFARPGSGLLPYNGQDNQYFGFVPGGEWWFAAISFDSSGASRFYVKTAAQVVEGNVTTESGVSGFTDGVAFAKFFNSVNTPDGKILIGVGINQGFPSLASMESLYTAMRPIHSTVTSLPPI